VCEVYEENGLRLVEVPNILFWNSGRFRAYACDSEHTIEVF
jgi:hypothetical protein